MTSDTLVMMKLYIRCRSDQVVIRLSAHILRWHQLFLVDSGLLVVSPLYCIALHCFDLL
jgi:hypothetical protein